MDATKIGTFIAAERRAKGWTQRQLAGELQLTDKAVSRWETGKGLPDVSLLLPLAAALGVSVGELLAGQRQPQPPVVQAAETRTAEGARLGQPIRAEHAQQPKGGCGENKRQNDKPEQTFHPKCRHPDGACQHQPQKL